jgi:hypothetical protein
MAAIPDSCGAFMRTLIEQCWSEAPESRPSFHRIIEFVQHADFDIIPGASHSVLRWYVTGVLRESN